MSLLKYQEDVDLLRGASERGRVFFGRASVDGVPFRIPEGAAERVPLRNEEFDAFCDTVYDVEVRLFDLSRDEDRRQYQAILDRAVNGWYRILHIMRRWKDGENGQGEGGIIAYVEWAVPFKEVNPEKLPPEMRHLAARRDRSQAPAGCSAGAAQNTQ